MSGAWSVFRCEHYRCQATVVLGDDVNGMCSSGLVLDVVFGKDAKIGRKGFLVGFLVVIAEVPPLAAVMLAEVWNEIDAKRNGTGSGDRAPKLESGCQ